MSFENDKKVFLNKLDKSKKKSIDKRIKKLVSLINSFPDYYTTSSCSGRIVLLKQKGKKGSEWLFSSHNKINFKQIKNIKLPKEEVWFKQEPLILHVCCKTIEDAKKFLRIVRLLFKRTGIISMGRKITIEIIGNEHIDTIIAKNNKLLVTEDYLKELVKEVNRKLEKNFSNIKKFYSLVNSIKKNQ